MLGIFGCGWNYWGAFFSLFYNRGRKKICDSENQAAKPGRKKKYMAAKIWPEKYGRMKRDCKPAFNSPPFIPSGSRENLPAPAHQVIAVARWPGLAAALLIFSLLLWVMAGRANKVWAIPHINALAARPMCPPAPNCCPNTAIVWCIYSV